jgi:hypothetical protein
LEGAEIDPSSRINYGKTYTIEYSVKVLGFGVIEQAHLIWLKQHYLTVMIAKTCVAARDEDTNEKTPENSEDGHDSDEDGSDEDFGLVDEE